MTNEALHPHLDHAAVSENPHYRAWVQNVAYYLANGLPIPENTNYESCLAKAPVELEERFRYLLPDG
ncbi:hypothetical protein [Streptomyces sp. NBC_00158]|uniref:hypothetical protein n=1 Tax=Streptomyces sp. NBC_00158 TaxID=2903627 RepID=UPI00324F607F